jgi:hypothetical protein
MSSSKSSKGGKGRRFFTRKLRKLRKQMGGNLYRGIPPGAKLANPIEWDT